MDAAATPWRATCCVADATCGASGLGHFPHLLCMSRSSEPGLRARPWGRVCACRSQRFCVRPYACVVLRRSAHVFLRRRVFSAFARVFLRRRIFACTLATRDPGQCQSFGSGWARRRRWAPTPPVYPPATELLSEGPAPRRSY